MSFDIRLLAAAPFGPPFGPMFFRIIQQITDDGEEDGSHLPMVQHSRDFKRRNESLGSTVSKYNEKMRHTVEGIQSDLRDSDDTEAKRLAGNLLKVNQMFQDFLQGLNPIIEEQKEAAKNLLDYLCPPTVELFHKKANAILQDHSPQQLSASKKNTCAICMEASADCVIKRSCDGSSSSSSRRRTHCEKDRCRCGPTMCRDCLLTHYWTSTEKGSKSYSKCVCCRAEFCLKDVFPVEYIDDDSNVKHPARTGDLMESKGKERDVHDNQEKSREDKGKEKSTRSRPARARRATQEDTNEQPTEETARETRKRRTASTDEAPEPVVSDSRKKRRGPDNSENEDAGDSPPRRRSSRNLRRS